MADRGSKSSRIRGGIVVRPQTARQPCFLKLCNQQSSINNCFCLPVSPVSRRRLLKLHLPCVPLFHPDGAEVLISRRRTLVLHRWNLHHGIVGHNRRIVTSRHHLHSVRLQILPGLTVLVHQGLPIPQLPVDTDERKIIGQRTLEKSHVALLRRLHKVFFCAHERLLQRIQGPRRCTRDLSIHAASRA